MRLIIVILISMFATASLSADRRFSVEGDTLVFDMTIEESGHKFTQQLERYDVNLLSDYLFEHPEIKILKLN